ncbi:MAG: MarR family transcriptional regulator [Oligoflexales bacterium]|nr:MarR family transcriptional regulator [Oligoflexales bacterium]
MDFKKIGIYQGPEESPGYLLWRTSTLWRRSIELSLKEIEITHSQFVVLATIEWLTKEAKSATQIDIGRQAGLDPNTTSQILRVLQKKGLVKRKHLTDERSKHSELTQEGSACLKKAMPVVEQADGKFFQELGSKDMSFMKALQALAYQE